MQYENKFCKQNSQSLTCGKWGRNTDRSIFTHAGHVKLLDFLHKKDIEPSIQMARNGQNAKIWIKILKVCTWCRSTRKNLNIRTQWEERNTCMSELSNQVDLPQHSLASWKDEHKSTLGETRKQSSAKFYFLSGWLRLQFWPAPSFTLYQGCKTPR